MDPVGEGSRRQPKATGREENADRLRRKQTKKGLILSSLAPAERGLRPARWEGKPRLSPGRGRVRLHRSRLTGDGVVA